MSSDASLGEHAEESVRRHWEVGALATPAVDTPEKFLDPLGIPRSRPAHHPHNHPARLAITHTASELSAISSSAIGYPNAHRSSGMCAKFMP